MFGRSRESREMDGDKTAKPITNTEKTGKETPTKGKDSELNQSSRRSSGKVKLTNQSFFYYSIHTYKNKIIDKIK